MTFRPRRRKNYIKWKDGRAYYHRDIPKKYRPLFGGKTAWVIALKGHGNAALEAEAAAYAHQHNLELGDHDDLGEEGLRAFIEAVQAANANPAAFTQAAKPSPPVWLDGRVQRLETLTIDADSARRRKDVAAGMVSLSGEEWAQRVRIAGQVEKAEAATDPDLKELAELRADKGKRDLERTLKVEDGETVLSVLPRWKAQKQQAPMTWQKHEQYAKEFAALHTNPLLEDVTKKQVVAYVEHVQSLTTNSGEPLSPTSIQKRLDSIRALLGFAVSVDRIPTNPATGVKAPEDKRPKTSRSWKSFTRDEVKTLVEVAGDLWGNRKERTALGRGADLMAALQALIWTGARPEEICQLRREDIDLTRRSIRITNDESDDEARAKVTKNDHSIREVPIHPTLQPILEAHLRTHNSPLVFPTFEPQARPKELAEAARTGKPVEMKGRYMFPLSREWTEKLREKVAGGDPRKVLYSLRHSWAAESRRAGMPEHVRNALMGHANDNPHAGRYGGDADWLEEKRRHLELMNCL